LEKANDFAKKAEANLKTRQYESNKPEKKFISKKEDKLGRLGDDSARDKKLLDKKILT